MAMSSKLNGNTLTTYGSSVAEALRSYSERILRDEVKRLRMENYDGDEETALYELLANMSNLRRFSASCCEGAGAASDGDQIFDAVCTRPKLRTYWNSACTTSPGKLAYLPKGLRLAHFWFKSPAPENLTISSDLRELYIYGEGDFRFDANFASALTSIGRYQPKWLTLTIDGAESDLDFLRGLSTCYSLRKLKFGTETCVGDSVGAIQAIGRIPNLRKLSLVSMPETFDPAELRSLTSLRVLEICHPPSDLGKLTELSTLRNLRKLRLGHLPNGTNDAEEMVAEFLQKLRGNLPNCDITIGRLSRLSSF